MWCVVCGVGVKCFVQQKVQGGGAKPGGDTKGKDKDKDKEKEKEADSNKKKEPEKPKVVATITQNNHTQNSSTLASLPSRMFTQGPS